MQLAVSLLCLKVFMREIIKSEIGEPVKPGTNRRHRFVPFLAGLAERTLDISDIEPLPIHNGLEAFRAGQVPVRGGFLETPSGLAAINAVPCRIDARNIVLDPALKREVGKDGRVLSDSAIVYQSESGLLKVIGVNFDPKRDPFLADRLGIPGYAIPSSGPVMAALPSDRIMDFEVAEAHNGTVIATPRSHYF